MRTELEENFTRSPNTERVYAAAWATFKDWCARANRRAMPASAETLALYIVWAVETRGYRLQTVTTHLAAIRDQHKQKGKPHHVGNTKIMRLMQLYARKQKERPGGMKALPMWALKKMAALFDPAKPLDVRNHAILVLTFNAGLRRSETANLDRDSLTFDERGGYLYLGATKTDPTGAEPPLWLKPAEAPENYDVCPVRTLQAWLKVRGEGSGPLFFGNTQDGQLEHRRMAQDVVYELVKRYANQPDSTPSYSARTRSAPG
jgi:integrase